MAFNALSELRSGNSLRRVRVYVSRLCHHRGETGNGLIKHMDLVILDSQVCSRFCWQGIFGHEGASPKFAACWLEGDEVPYTSGWIKTIGGDDKLCNLQIHLTITSICKRDMKRQR